MLKAPNAAVHSARTGAANQFAPLSVSELYLKRISFGQRTSVPHVATGVFSTLVGETVGLRSAVSPQSGFRRRRCRVREVASFNQKHASSKRFASFPFSFSTWLITMLIAVTVLNLCDALRRVDYNHLFALAASLKGPQHSLALKKQRRSADCVPFSPVVVHKCFLFIKCIADFSFFIFKPE